MADEGGEKPAEPELGSPVARQFLEGLQESIYKTGLFGRPMISDWTDEQRANTEEQAFKMALEMLKRERAVLGREVTQADIDQARAGAHEFIYAKVPTRFEEPGTHRIVLQLAKQVENAIEAVVIPDLGRPHPLIGTLPTGQVNAMAIRVPNTDEHVVVFESQIFNFCLLFSKAVSMAFVFKGVDEGQVSMSVDLDDIVKRINENQEIGQRFFEVLSAYIAVGDPGAAPQYLPPEPWGTIAGIFRDAMEFFIMAHEYAHVLLNHTGQGKKTAALLGGNSAEVLEWTKQQELDADAFGVILLLASQDLKVDFSLRFVGVTLFFGALSVVERALTYLLFGEERQLTSSTHPGHLTRLSNAFSSISGLPFVSDEDREAIKKLAETILTIIEVLWDGTRPIFADMRERGMAPHKMWTFGLDDQPH